MRVLLATLAVLAVATTAIEGEKQYYLRELDIRQEIISIDHSIPVHQPTNFIIQHKRYDLIIHEAY